MCRRAPAKPRDETACRQMCLRPSAILTAAQLHRHCQIIGKRHAGADRLAMKKGAVITAHRFKRVSKGMAQIEKRALPGFPFVRLDNAGLCIA